MAVNKNFVVKNGLEVNFDLILADADNKLVGIGTSSPDFLLDVHGGIGATSLTVSGFSTFTEGIQVGSSGSIFYVDDTTNLVGVGTSVPTYLLDVRTAVSTGQTGLYVQGDSVVTGTVGIGSTKPSAKLDVDGSLNVSGFSTFVGYSTFIGSSLFEDYVTIEDGLNVLGSGTTTTTLNVSGVSTFGDTVEISSLTENRVVIVGAGSTFEDDPNFTFDGSQLVVGVGLTVAGVSTFADSVNVGAGLTVTGISTFNDTVFVEGNSGVGVTITTDGNAEFVGVVTAAAFYGDGSNLTGIATGLTATIGVRSEGTYIGAGVTQIDFATTSGVNVQLVETDIASGIATVTIDPGVSLGLAIALGG